MALLEVTAVRPLYDQPQLWTGPDIIVCDAIAVLISMVAGKFPSYDAMFLNIGNQHRIEDPSGDHVGRALRDLPIDAPFVVADAGNNEFVQATPAGAVWRVEWREGRHHRFMITTLPRTEEAFDAFLRLDEVALIAMPWKRLRLWNDPYRRFAFMVGIMVLGALAQLWSFFR